VHLDKSKAKELVWVSSHTQEVRPGRPAFKFVLNISGFFFFWLRGDLRATFQYLKEAYRKDGENLFSKACCDRIRSNGFKLSGGKFRTDTRKKFFTVRVVKHWHRLSREAVEAPPLETFKVRLDGALSNLV